MIRVPSLTLLWGCLRWRFLLFFALGFTVLCRLGFWQLSRAAQKEESYLSFAQAATLLPLNNNSLLQEGCSPNPIRFRKVILEGAFEEAVFLLDNSIQHGHVGYEVFSPFKIADEAWILIDRGWIPLGPSRDTLPVIENPPMATRIEGYVDFAYRNPLSKQIVEKKLNDWPTRVQALDLPLLSDQLDMKLLPMVIVLDQGSPYALVTRDTSRYAAGTSPARHRAYAVQWFALAIVWLFYPLFYLRKVNHDTSACTSP